DKLVLTSVTPASSAPVLQTPKATSSTLYFDSLTVNAGNGGFLHCIQMDTSVNAANQVVSVGADIAFDADPKFLQRIFLMSSLMLLLVWLIFFMVLIKLLPILGTISGKTVKLMVLALICLGNNRQD